MSIVAVSITWSVLSLVKHVHPEKAISHKVLALKCGWWKPGPSNYGLETFKASTKVGAMINLSLCMNIDRRRETNSSHDELAHEKLVGICHMTNELKIFTQQTCWDSPPTLLCFPLNIVCICIAFPLFFECFFKDFQNLFKAFTSGHVGEKLYYALQSTMVFVKPQRIDWMFVKEHPDREILQ